ncbi:MAG: hypothetical protein KZQ94_16010 [Candidatus Thiodiazotropha sp. (ex Troendleina suluensis)]|nr:hypothetical protein [Candidatus Thiodiazotropha sp. (ex Troendleina suluensis)]
MKTAIVNNKREKITYKTNTEMFTRLTSDGYKTSQYGADIYTVDNSDKHIRDFSGVISELGRTK